MKHSLNAAPWETQNLQPTYKFTKILSFGSLRQLSDLEGSESQLSDHLTQLQIALAFVVGIALSVLTLVTP